MLCIILDLRGHTTSMRAVNPFWHIVAVYEHTNTQTTESPWLFPLRSLWAHEMVWNIRLAPPQPIVLSWLTLNFYPICMFLLKAEFRNALRVLNQLGTFNSHSPHLQLLAFLWIFKSNVFGSLAPPQGPVGTALENRSRVSLWQWNIVHYMHWQIKLWSFSRKNITVESEHHSLR